MLTDEIEIPAWPAATAEDDVLDQVRRRARVIKAQRRLPAGLAALAIVTAVAVTASTGAGQPSGLRTAGQDDGPYLVDESREAEAGPVSGSAQAQAWNNPPGGRAYARARAGTPAGDVGVDAGDPGINEAPTVPLTGHPLYRDEAGDPTSPSNPFEPTAMPAIDLTICDIQLEDDTLVFRTTVADLASFRGDGSDLLYFTLSAKAHGDVYLQASAYIDRSLQVTYSYGALFNNGGAGADVPVTFEIDDASSTVVTRIRLADINKATEDAVLAARSAQGDITFRPGTRLSDLATLSSHSTDSLASVATGVSDQANAPYGSFWAIGD